MTMIARGDYYLVLDRAPTPDELRKVEAEEKMLLNVLYYERPLVPHEDPMYWVDKYLAKFELWASDRMAVRFAFGGKSCVECADEWVDDIDRAVAKMGTSFPSILGIKR